jgi:hypothetical protein
VPTESDSDPAGRIVQLKHDLQRLRSGAHTDLGQSPHPKELAEDVTRGATGRRMAIPSDSIDAGLHLNTMRCDGEYLPFGARISAPDRAIRRV